MNSVFFPFVVGIWSVVGVIFVWWKLLGEDCETWTLKEEIYYVAISGLIVWWIRILLLLAQIAEILHNTIFCNFKKWLKK